MHKANETSTNVLLGLIQKQQEQQQVESSNKETTAFANHLVTEMDKMSATELNDFKHSCSLFIDLPNE